MPCLFHANLFALDIARCPVSIYGVAIAAEDGNWLVGT